jgi:hypothetical protein
MSDEMAMQKRDSILSLEDHSLSLSREDRFMKCSGPEARLRVA